MLGHGEPAWPGSPATVCGGCQSTVRCAPRVVIDDMLAGHDSEVVEPRSDLDDGTGSKDELAVHARS
jgi:hypothetical protein